MALTLTRRFSFSAAHRLDAPAMSASEQAACFGPCVRTHGHNYRLEVSVRGEIDPRSGFFANVMQLDAVVRRLIVDRFDHHLLNELDLFAGHVVTMETIASVIWAQIQQPLADAGMTLSEVLIAETDEHWVRLNA